MDRFKNILVVYRDAVGGDGSLTQASALARRNAGRVMVVEVVEHASVPAEYLAERRKHLARLVASMDAEGARADAVLLQGTPFLEIIRQVSRAGHDLVIMPAEGDVGFKNLFFGSTSMKLMRKCPCPVWITKPGPHSDYERILAAVDPGEDDAESNGLNTDILDLSTSLAESNGSDLHVAYAWELAGHDLDSMQSETTAEQREALKRRNEQLHAQSLERLTERYCLKDPKHHVHLLHGQPAFVLPQFVHEEDVDLVVMGTVGRTGIGGFIIGNTAELVLRQVTCAVLTIKPKGFSTPITLHE
jgi:nucleotide-binding universal stress UspA family protein